MARRTWADNDASKPLSAARMTGLEDDIEAAMTAALAASGGGIPGVV
jgi:hypothetical protein